MILSCTPKMTQHLSYGAFPTEKNTMFRVHAPSADKLYLVIFSDPAADTGKEFPMIKQPNGDWELTINNVGFGTLYGYRAEGSAPGLDPKVIVADPYSKAAVTQNSYRHVAKSLIVNTDYDWEDDSWLALPPSDLMIYEMHLKDMTAHPTSGVKAKGTYLGLIEPNQKGGIHHIKDLGVNAVQILPLQDFANFELPFNDTSTDPVNTWNPYARNHWGYMTTFFFAPESYYASDGSATPEAWNGTSGKAVREMKDMVKALHKEGIAVIMDVVYNHVSNYDYHPLKYLGRDLYFRLDANRNYEAKSGCGNDTRTESRAMRKLILESVKYWMTEYHVDGFRFDLGYLIDSDTRAQIISELQKINPNVIILAEPWGGGYDPAGFSDQGWASFNDQFRDGLKGSTFDIHDKGFLFGKYRNGDNQDFLKQLVMGSLREFGGHYITSAHSVNYLESHDDLTFGDRLRITGGFVGEHEQITQTHDHTKTVGQLLSMNKLGALYLLTSQGIVFLHEGQEWARSKVIASTSVPDNRIGQIDHNSYEKDNETNWLNWKEKELNKQLVNYYKGLIQLRKTYPAIRKSTPKEYEFFDLGQTVAVGYILKNDLIIVLNGESEKSVSLILPDGQWKILANHSHVDLEGIETVEKEILIRPTSGIVLVKNRKTG